MRAIFVISLIVIGVVYALRSPFFALLFYFWIAYFRPETWLWYDFVSALNLSLLVGVFLLASSVLSKQKFRFDLRTGLLSLLFVHTLISVALSEYFDYQWPYWIDFAKAMVICYLITVLVTTRQRLRLAVLTISLSLGFEAAKQGWAQLVLNPTGVNRNAIPFLGDNNAVAVGMFMLLPLLRALATTAHSRWERYLHNFLAVGILWRGLTTYSRGGFLSCAVMGGVMAWRSPNRLRNIAAMLVVGTVVLSVLPDAYWQRMGTITTEEQEMDSSAAGRLHFWEVAVEMANANPVLGVGQMGYNPSYEQYDSSNGLYGIGRSVHSAWFGILAEQGYLGLLLFGAILGMSLQACRRVRKIAKSDATKADLRAYAGALETGLAVMMVGGAFVPFQYTEMLWHFAALTTALRNVALEDRPVESTVVEAVTSAPVEDCRPVHAFHGAVQRVGPVKLSR